MTRLLILLCAVLLVPNIRCDFFSVSDPIGRTLTFEKNYEAEKFGEALNRKYRSIFEGQSRSTAGALEGFSTNSESLTGERTNRETKKDSIPAKLDEKRQDDNSTTQKSGVHEIEKRQDNKTQSTQTTTSTTTVSAKIEKRDQLESTYEISDKISHGESREVCKREKNTAAIVPLKEIREIERRQDDNITHKPDVRQVDNVTHLVSLLEATTKAQLQKRQDDNVTHAHNDKLQDSNTTHQLERRQDNTTHHLEGRQDDNTTHHLSRRQDNDSAHHLLQERQDNDSAHHLLQERQDNDSAHHLLQERQDDDSAHHLLQESQDETFHARVVRDNRFFEQFRQHLREAPQLAEKLEESSGSENVKGRESDEINIEEETRPNLDSAAIAEESDTTHRETLLTEDQDSLLRSTIETKDDDRRELLHDEKEANSKDRSKRTRQRVTGNAMKTEKIDAEDYDIEEEEPDSKEAELQNKRENPKKATGKRWDHWGAWTPCSVTCGRGKITRWRHCIGEGCAPGEKEAQIKTCIQPVCP